MKVQCDVCEKAQATVLCCADEASLCADCDTRVHAANKLANKHQRVPLIYPSSEDLPCCDICQEKTGYFFCLEDRALLCRNCDYSIHSRNALAAKHKRFLVSGVFVGLQPITGREQSEIVQACSLSLVSSPSTHVSQLSSPTTTHLTHLCLPKNAGPQKPVRLTPFFNKKTCLVPQESSSPIVETIKEDIFSNVPTLQSAMKEQQQPSSVSPPLSTAKQEQHLQQIMLTSSQQKSQIAPTGIFPSKTVGSMPLVSASIDPQVCPDGERQPLYLGMCTKVNFDADDMKKTTLPSLKGSACGHVGSSSISEYLTESVPGWRVAELLSLPDFDSEYCYADAGISKTDAGTADVDWPAECSMSESEELRESVAAAVPRVPSPPTASGVPRLTKPGDFGKSLKETDMNLFLRSDEPLVVPDIGNVSSPTNLPPFSLPQEWRSPVEF